MNKTNLEGINFTDKELTIVKLFGNRTYLVDGQLITTDYQTKQVEVSNVDDIRLVSINKITKHYTDGVDNMSINDYDIERNKLMSAYDSEYESWNSLEDEFAYRKFANTWQPIYEEVQMISEPIKVEIVDTTFETDNPYIGNNFSISGGKKSATLFTYYRQKAIENIVHDCFKSLDMKYQLRLDYGQTKGKKVWSNADHSGIRYVVAFGEYIFSKKWDIKPNFVGTLEQCKDLLESDKKELECIIINKYKEHFGKFDEGSFNYQELLNNLDGVATKLGRLDVKKSAMSDLCQLQSLVNKARELVLNHLK